jgi:hypothetical protein
MSTCDAGMGGFTLSFFSSISVGIAFPGGGSGAARIVHVSSELSRWHNYSLIGEGVYEIESFLLVLSVFLLTLKALPTTHRSRFR